MSRVKLGLYDDEPEYVRRLGAFLMLNEKEHIEPHIFTEKERLISSMSHLDAVLVPESFTCEDQGIIIVRFVERWSEKQVGQIKKYQKASDIVSELKRMLSINETCDNFDKGKLIGIVNPACHELHMLYSMCLCKEVSIRQKSLYVSLYSNSGLSLLFCEDEETDMEDLLADLVAGNVELERYVRTFQGVSFIPPIKRPEVLHEIDTDLMRKFIMTLQESSYEKIIVDIDGMFPECYQLLDKCEYITILCKEDALSDCCVEEYLANLRRHLSDDSMNHCNKVMLPLNGTGIMRSEFMMDELYRGNLGNFIRHNLEDEWWQNCLKP